MSKAKAIIIGSAALHMTVGLSPRRTQKPIGDIDVVLSNDITNDELRSIESVLIDLSKDKLTNKNCNIRIDSNKFSVPGLFGVMAECIIKSKEFDQVLYDSHGILIMTPSVYCTLLHTHLQWKSKNGKYGQYVETYAWLLSKGFKADDTTTLLYGMLMEQWAAIKGSKDHIKLTAKEKFFTKTVKRDIDHDELHEIFALSDDGIPMFKKILSDNGNGVMCSYSKFLDLSVRDKAYCVLEEVFVTATERKLSFKSGLVHLATSLSRGWFADYVVELMPKLFGYYLDPRDQLTSDLITIIDNHETKFKKFQK